jgi:transposase
LERLLTDPVTGEKIPTQLFVGALGASSYTFATATLSQALPAWLDCHVRMFELYQGVSTLTIPAFVPGCRLHGIAGRGKTPSG